MNPTKKMEMLLKRLPAGHSPPPTPSWVLPEGLHGPHGLENGWPRCWTEAAGSQADLSLSSTAISDELCVALGKRVYLRLIFGTGRMIHTPWGCYADGNFQTERGPP